MALLNAFPKGNEMTHFLLLCLHPSSLVISSALDYFVMCSAKILAVLTRSTLESSYTF